MLKQTLTQLHDSKKSYFVKDCIVMEVELEVSAFKYKIKRLTLACLQQIISFIH